MMLGSKIENLKKLKDNNINVPSFIIIKYDDVVKEKVNKEEYIELINNIKINNELNGNLFAIRSSCNLEDSDTLSFAGLFDTYLNIPKKQIEKYVKKCFLSLYNKNVLEYINKNNINFDELKMNVIIQEMVSSEISGVLFTSNPLGIINESVIVVSKGLGENVVSDKGLTTSYYYNLTDKLYYYEGMDILTKNQIDTLINESEKIKNILGDYLDIEFAFEKNKLFILQARNITTIKDDNLVVLDNSNIVESYPNISSPLTISFVNEVYTNIFTKLVIRVLKNKKELKKLTDVLNNMTSSVNGRMYYKISSWYTLLKYIPFSKKIIPIWQDMLGLKSKKVTTKDIKISSFSKLKISINYLIELFSSKKNMKKLNKEFIKINDYFYNNFNDNLTNEEVIKLYKEVEDKVLSKWDVTLINDMYAFIYTGLLKKYLNKKGLGETANKYISGISNIESIKPIRELINLSYNKDKYSKIEFENKKNEYIKLYGDCSLEELKLESITFKTNKELLDKKIEEYRSDLKKLEQIYKDINKNEIVKLHENIIIKYLKKRVDIGIKNREISRLNRSRLFGMVRSMFLKIGANLEKSNIIDNKRDIFYLTKEEIFNLSDIDYKKIIKQRKQQYSNYSKLPPFSKLIFMNKEFDKNICDIKTNEEFFDNQKLSGVPSSFGIVEGEALVITDINNIQSTKDKILITKMTDPGWVFLIANSKGIISEKGSLLSHTAIISRELKIPSIVGVKDLLKNIHTGDIIKMDANTGVIQVLKRSKHADN